MEMSSESECESLQGLLFTHNLYANPRHEHKNRNIRIRFIIVSIIMLFFLLLISTVFILIRTAPIDQSQSTTTFSTDK